MIATEVALYPPVSGERFWGTGVAVAVGNGAGPSVVASPSTVGTACPLVPLPLLLKVAGGIGVTVDGGNTVLSKTKVGEGVAVPSFSAVAVSAGVGVSGLGVSGVLTAVTGGAMGVPVGGSTPPDIGAVAVSVPFNSVFSVGWPVSVTVTVGLGVISTVVVGTSVAVMVSVASGVPVTATVPVISGVEVIATVPVGTAVAVITTVVVVITVWVGTTVAVNSTDGVNVFSA